MTDLRKAAEMALEALESAANNEGNFHDYKYAANALRQALAQPEQRENRMTDREAIQKALDTPHRRYSIEPHGNGYAIYRDRDLFHHGFNLGHLTEVTPETIELIENALNTTLAQPANQSDCGHKEYRPFCQMCMATKQKPEQKPVAWLEYDDEGYLFLSGKRKGAFPVFIAPSSKPEQEPVAFEDWLKNQHGDPEEIGFLQALRVAYYAGADSHTAPPSKSWVSLTKDDYDIIFYKHDCYDDIARAIETALRSKNNG